MTQNYTTKKTRILTNQGFKQITLGIFSLAYSFFIYRVSIDWIEFLNAHQVRGSLLSIEMGLALKVLFIAIVFLSGISLFVGFFFGIQQLIQGLDSFEEVEVLVK